MLARQKEMRRIRVALVILSGVVSMIGGQQIASAETVETELAGAVAALQ